MSDSNFPWNYDDQHDFGILVDPLNAPRFIQPPAEYIGIPSVGILAARSPVVPYVSGLEALLASSNEEVVKIIGNPDLLGKSKDERYANYMRHVARNAYYQWLATSPHFVKAQRFFQKQAKRKRPTPYSTEWAEFTFLTGAGFIGIYATAEKIKYRPRIPSARQRAQGFRRAKALSESFEFGVGLGSFGQQQHLSRLLGLLVGELGRPQLIRPRNDETIMGRQFVEQLSRHLLNAFNEASPTIVLNFAVIAGYAPDATTIERQIKKARREWNKQRTAAALTAPLQKLT